MDYTQNEKIAQVTNVDSTGILTDLCILSFTV